MATVASSTLRVASNVSAVVGFAWFSTSIILFLVSNAPNSAVTSGSNTALYLYTLKSLSGNLTVTCGEGFHTSLNCLWTTVRACCVWNWFPKALVHKLINSIGSAHADDKNTNWDGVVMSVKGKIVVVIGHCRTGTVEMLKNLEEWVLKRII